MDDSTSLTASCQRKLHELQGILREMGSILVAFSGGVDSTFLLKVAAETEGVEVLGVTATSPTYIDAECQRARELAEILGVKHLAIESSELENPDFRRNPPERCYHCKMELFGELLRIAQQRGIQFVADASNADDCLDFRPGREAARELGVRSPLVEAGLNKEDIRALSKRMGLPTWNKPSMACLASRVPYGEEITAEKLRRVARAERFLREKGFEQLRVRSHAELARIEVEPERVGEFAAESLRRQVAERLKGIGFTYVTIDLDGYRSGSMNEVLDDAVTRQGKHRRGT